MSKRPRQPVQAQEDAGSDIDDVVDSDVESMIETTLPAAGKANFSKDFINNLLGLQRALATVKKDLPWIERLEVVSAEPLNASAEDDLKLELGFYGQALAAATAARGELERLGVQHRRPDDYFAEMLKTDDHMQKVKERLIHEQKKISAVEHRKRDKEAALYSKQVAAERVRQKAAEKRSHEDTLKQWRKHKDSRTDLSKADDLDAMFEATNKRQSTPATRGKRAAKDRKYGHGGPKRLRKENSAQSSASNHGFSAKRNKTLPPGVKPKKPRNAGASRPGKRARISKKSR